MTLRLAVLGRGLVFVAAAAAAAFQVFLAMNGTSRVHGGTEPVKAGPPANLASVATLDPARVLHLYLSDERLEPPEASVPSGVAFDLVVHSRLSAPVTLRLDGASPMDVIVAPGDTNQQSLTLGAGTWRLSTGRPDQTTTVQVH